MFYCNWGFITVDRASVPLKDSILFGAVIDFNRN